MNIKNIFDSVDKEIKDKFKNCPTKEKIKKYKKYCPELIEGIKYIYAHEDVVIPVIMGGRSPEAIEFRSKLGFTQYDITLKKESSVLKSIMETFEGDNMETQYNVLAYRADLYFYDYKIAIEVAEKGHKNRNEDYEKQIQKEIESELSCKFIRIIPDEENFNISKVNNKIFRSITKLLKKLNEDQLKIQLLKI